VKDSTGLRKYPAGIVGVQLEPEDEEGGLYFPVGQRTGVSIVPEGQ
jgi:hypothetical protein